MSAKIPRSEVLEIKAEFGESNQLSFDAWCKGHYNAWFNVLSQSLLIVSQSRLPEDVRSEALELKLALETKVEELDKIPRRYRELAEEQEQSRIEAEKLEYEISSLIERHEGLRSELEELLAEADGISRDEYEDYLEEMRVAGEEVNRLRQERVEITGRYEDLGQEQETVYESGVPMYKDLVHFVAEICDFILEYASDQEKPRHSLTE